MSCADEVFGNRKVRRRATSSRGQRGKVAGLTRNAGQRSLGNSFASYANTICVCRGGAGASDLSAKNRQLMAQHGDLDVSGIRRRTQAEHPKQPPHTSRPTNPASAPPQH
jgi:hypothetical protein